MPYSTIATSTTPTLTITAEMQVRELNINVFSTTSTDVVNILLVGTNPTGDNVNFPNVPVPASPGEPYNDSESGGRYIQETVIDFSGLGTGYARILFKQA